MIRVGRVVNRINPKYDGYRPIICLTKCTTYGELGPYVLEDDDGCIMENIWQFSKVYKNVPASKQYYSQWDDTVIWDHPAETHIDSDGNLTDEYWEWRRKGYNNKYPVRYPVGMKHRSECLYSFYNEKN